MRKTVAIASLFAMILPSAANAEAPGKALGLRVGAGGQIFKEGKPFRGVGVNYFSLFYDVLKDPQDLGYREGLKALAEKGIPFVRFMGSGFWPSDNALYFQDKEAYFKLFDGVVKAAEQAGVGLIPSLFWCSSTVPDLVKEPVGQWGNPESKTHLFMLQYTREVVGRYRSSPAIWGWEFGNEYPLSADLPNASEHRPAVVLELGTPSSRSEKDELTHDDIRVALQAFAEEVRQLDPDRVIVSGNSLPRGSAWHQKAELSWQYDSPAQFAEMLLGDNPDPMDAFCVHLYGEEERFGGKVSHEELLGMIMDLSKVVRKPLFVGEFGVSRDGGVEREKEDFQKLLQAIEKTRVPLSALWVYRHAGQDDVWNVTPTNERSYQLDAIAEANRRMRE